MLHYFETFECCAVERESVRLEGEAAPQPRYRKFAPVLWEHTCFQTFLRVCSFRAVKLKFEACLLFCMGAAKTGLNGRLFILQTIGYEEQRLNLVRTFTAHLRWCPFFEHGQRRKQALPPSPSFSGSSPNCANFVTRQRGTCLAVAPLFFAR